ncbi:unnamed protein product [Paramecium sonneborni]|uniref:GTP-eEF1A C-terminal domain-containing protein n=1 Tax=Paramecium sonneborni TaxID=65129 RepID=A0A8S1KKJ4_9CILI|nr:unnamed protein product [Paramecium sonneborni]
MIQQPQQLFTNKINVLIFGQCPSDKTTLLDVLKKENQKQNYQNQQFQDNLDSEEDEEEALDQFESLTPTTRCLYIFDKYNIYFEESNNFNDLLYRSPNFEVLMFLFNAQEGIFENQIFDGFYWNLEGVRLLQQNQKIIFAITNMCSCNWSKQRFEQIQNHFQSLNLNFQFVIIPIDSKQSINIFHKQCEWYEGDSLIDEISSIQIKNFTEILRIRVLNLSKRQNYAYECKVLSGQINQINIPFHLNSIIQKKPIQIVGILDLIDNLQFNITQNDMIQILVNNDTVLKIGDILSLPHLPPCHLSKEILADFHLENLKQQSIITSGFKGLLNFCGIQTPFEVTNVEYINIDGKKQIQEFLKSKQSGGVKIKFPEPFCLEKSNVFFELGYFLILSIDQQIIGTGCVVKVKPL